jgi:hypothetical protein
MKTLEQIQEENRKLKAANKFASAHSYEPLNLVTT